MIAEERGAGPDDLESHVVAAAPVGLLRSVQRAAVSAEMQLDLVPLMDAAVDLLESGLARFAARPRPRPVAQEFGSNRSSYSCEPLERRFLEPGRSA